jgi:DNA-binding beta-propeller fold protein YncE
MRGGTAQTSKDAAVRSTVRTPPAPPVALTSLGGCAYSPAFLDDTTVVFDLTRGGAVDLYRVAVASSAAPVRLTNDPAWEWRAARGSSGNQVVFMWQSDEGLGIDTLDLSTAKRQTLFPAENGPVLFAGDSYFHAPAKRNTLRRFHAGRDEIIATIPDGSDVETMAASSDASQLALMLRGKDATYQLCLFEVATAKLACTPATPHGARPAFSATGTAVYFDSAAGIERIASDRTTIDTMIPGVIAVGGITVSPSGRSLVYSACTAHTKLLQFVDNLVRDAEPEGDMPAIGLGGMRAFVRTNEHGRALVIRNADGTEREVTRRKNRITNITISHDGQKLAYVLADSKEPGIYLSEIRGNAAPNRLTDQAGDGEPLFFGDSLVFTRWAADGTPHLFQVRLDGSAEAPLGRRPRISVDADADHSRILIASPNRDFLYWFDPTTRTESPGPLLPPGRDPADLALSPDGRWLMVLGGNNGHQIWRYHLDVPDAKPELVHQLGDDFTALVGAIDDDGHPLIAVDTWSGELWLSSSPEHDPW